MARKIYTFIDCEYAFTCAMSEGQIPNYRGIINMMDGHFINNTILAYFMGQKEKKKGVADFLVSIGVDQINTIDIEYCSKTQVIGATIAVDVAKLVATEQISQFVFLSGNPYMIPIVQTLNEYGLTPIIYYYPQILSDELKTMNCKLNRLAEGYFIFPKRRENGHETVHSVSSSGKQT